MNHSDPQQLQEFHPASSSRAYCTFFDVGYLSRGIAMIESLRNNGDKSPVYVLALDNHTLKYFSEHKFENVRVLEMSQIEDFSPELLAVRDHRSRMEYYFTTTPQLFKYIFSLENKHGLVVTYLDADLYFFQSPDAIFECLGDGSVGITEHRYSERLKNKLAQYGRFNAGFVCFKNDEDGNVTLSWWANKALEWCSDVPTDGKYANQGYLDSFPSFTGVVILDNPGLNLAPWNTARHQIRINDEHIAVADNKPVVFFHFHGLRKVKSWFVTSQLIYGSRLTPAIKAGIYQPYVDHLVQVEKLLISQNVAKPDIKKRGNGLHGVLARAWKFGMDRLSIVTGNALKPSN